MGEVQVRSMGATQRELSTAHWPSMHLTGLIGEQTMAVGQSAKLALQLPSGHLVAWLGGHWGTATGHWLLSETHVRSSHNTGEVSEHAIDCGQRSKQGFGPPDRHSVQEPSGQDVC